MQAANNCARFSNVLAVVTGGASGIGAAVCKRLAGEQAHVIIADINPGPAKAIAEHISQNGGSAVAVQIDTTDEARVAELFSREANDVSVLVNVAGLMWPSPFDQIGEEDWNKAFGVNFRGYFNMMQCASNAMRRQGRSGSIVNTASTRALVACPGLMAYSVSKAAVIQLSKSAAVDLAQYNIRVNTVVPGGTNTEGVREFVAKYAQPGMPALALPPCLFPRLAEPEEVAAGIAFLASSDASFVTGTELVIDAGCSII